MRMATLASLSTFTDASTSGRSNGATLAIPIVQIAEMVSTLRLGVLSSISLETNRGSRTARVDIAEGLD